MHVQYYEKACYDAWRHMQNVDVHPYGQEALEFLAAGATPVWKAKPMQSPRRYIGTDGGKTCTITVAMLRDIPKGEFQRQPLGPRLSRDFMSFKMLNLAVSDIFKDCISNKFDQAFGWARPGGML
ncbi:MAG: hypothetical protein Q9203_005002 [Teloschistes exilis]